jgi:hypothetical protein
VGLKRKPPPGNVRRVHSNGLSIRGTLTNKAGRIVQFESHREYTLTLRFERNHRIVDYGSQPLTFTFPDEHGKGHTYTPDFIAWLDDGSIEIHEVTDTKRRTRPDIRQREEAAEAICRERHWKYVVHTQETLPEDSELANLLFLFRYRPQVYSNERVAETLLKLLVSNQPVQLRGLVAHLVSELSMPSPEVVAAIGHLLWHGVLSTNLHQLLFIHSFFAPKAVVWLSTQEE